MKCCDSLTRTSAASSSVLSERYWGLRSSSGTFTARALYLIASPGSPRAALPQVGHARRARRTRFVVLQVPLDEPADAGLHRGRGLVAHVTHQVFDVRKGVRHVAGLQRQHVPDRLLAETVLEHLDVADEVHRRV